MEFGWGNTWWVRTEIEEEDGTEREVKGISKPFIAESVYIRIWLGRKVWIWDSKEGIKSMHKSRRTFKLILGFSGSGTDEDGR